MKTHPIAVVLFLLNITLLLLLSAKPQQQTFHKITVQEFDLVDKNGQSRANITTYPDSEVVFRLKDAKGIIRVKLGASQEGSGLVLLNHKTEVGIHALTKSNGSSIVISGSNGKKQEIKP